MSSSDQLAYPGFGRFSGSEKLTFRNVKISKKIIPQKVSGTYSYIFSLFSTPIFSLFFPTFFFTFFFTYFADLFVGTLRGCSRVAKCFHSPKVVRTLEGCRLVGGFFEGCRVFWRGCRVATVRSKIQ